MILEFMSFKIALFDGLFYLALPLSISLVIALVIAWWTTPNNNINMKSIIKQFAIVLLPMISFIVLLFLVLWIGGYVVRIYDEKARKIPIAMGIWGNSSNTTEIEGCDPNMPTKLKVIYSTTPDDGGAFYIINYDYNQYKDLWVEIEKAENLADIKYNIYRTNFIGYCKRKKYKNDEYQELTLGLAYTEQDPDPDKRVSQTVKDYQQLIFNKALNWIYNYSRRIIFVKKFEKDFEPLDKFFTKYANFSSYYDKDNKIDLYILYNLKDVEKWNDLKSQVKDIQKMLLEKNMMAKYYWISVKDDKIPLILSQFKKNIPHTNETVTKDFTMLFAGNCYTDWGKQLTNMASEHISEHISEYSTSNQDHEITHNLAYYINALNENFAAKTKSEAKMETKTETKTETKKETKTETKTEH